MPYGGANSLKSKSMLSPSSVPGSGISYSEPHTAAYFGYMSPNVYEHLSCPASLRVRFALTITYRCQSTIESDVKDYQKNTETIVGVGNFGCL